MTEFSFLCEPFLVGQRKWWNEGLGLWNRLCWTRKDLANVVDWLTCRRAFEDWGGNTLTSRGSLHSQDSLHYIPPLPSPAKNKTTINILQQPASM